MGARPAYAFLALASGPAFEHRRFFNALLAACHEHGVTLAGGDLARSPAHGAATIATLTVLGHRQPRGRWLRRASARAGHALWLGGCVGESAAGRLVLAAGARCRGRQIELPPALKLPRELAAAARRAVRRHLWPEPQLELGAWLARRSAGAAIDVSDGLARDLHRLCRASAAGAEVERCSLPLPPRFFELCARLGADPWPLALAGGEDYVLLFTLPRPASPPPRFGCHRIGSITFGSAVRLLTGGAAQPLADLGWDHLDPAGAE